MPECSINLFQAMEGREETTVEISFIFKHDFLKPSVLLRSNVWCIMLSMCIPLCRIRSGQFESTADCVILLAFSVQVGNQGKSVQSILYLGYLAHT